MVIVRKRPGNLSALAPAGFKLESHDLTLLGLCDVCGVTKKPGASAGAKALK